MLDKVSPLITVEDLMNFDEDRWIEVVNGELVETDMSAASYLHSIVIDNLYNILKPFTRANKLGRVFGDGLTYVLHLDENGRPHTHIPDVSFIRRQNLPTSFDRTRPLAARPDLAVEVVSPNESAETLADKIGDYMRFGTEQAWAIYPIQRQIYVYHQNKPEQAQLYYANDVLEAPLLFPGLQIKVASLFVIDEDY